MLRPVLGAAISLGLEPAQAAEGLAQMTAVPGRFERVGDLWAPVLGPGIDLPAALAATGRQVLLKGLAAAAQGADRLKELHDDQRDERVGDGLACEGVADLVKHTLRESLEATISAKIGYVFSRTALSDFKKRLDYSEYGGAPLLGVRGVCIISHGRANSNAIRNAIRFNTIDSSAAPPQTRS